MALKYKLHKKASIELDEALAWYNKKGGKNLASLFLKDYQKSRTNILNNPKQFIQVENGWRHNFCLLIN